MSRRRSFALAAMLLALAVVLKGYWNATRDPVVRRATLELADWPFGEKSLTVMLISDVHVAGPDMPPSRVARIVGQLNAEKPDIVLIAGDFISEKSVATQTYSPDEVAAPLGMLRARLGVVAVMGNHDHWSNASGITAALTRSGITVLSNSAMRRGPLIIGGVDDDFTGHDNLPATFAAMDALGRGARIVLSHSPDIVPKLPEPVDAVMAGHMHCGQIVLPFYGAITYPSRFGARFACGLIDDHGQRVVVTAGLGTSVVPLRYGAHPDVWLITLARPKSPRG